MAADKSCFRELTKDDDKCHFNRFDFGAWDDAAGTCPPALLILVQHGRPGASARSINT